MPTWGWLLSSAAIGAAVSALVTIAGQLLGQHFERRVRLRELFLTKAVDLARAKNDRIVQVAATSSRGKWLIDDEIYLVRSFFEDLEHLFASGTLTATSEQHYQRAIKPVRERKEP